MILKISKSEFKRKIIDGIKVHAIIKDKSNRWKVSSKIHFYFRNQLFAVGEVSRVESIRIDFANIEDWQEDIVYIGEDIKLKGEILNYLAINEGFENWAQMKFYFKNSDEVYLGKIIFWNKINII